MVDINSEGDIEAHVRLMSVNAWGPIGATGEEMQGVKFTFNSLDEGLHEETLILKRDGAEVPDARKSPLYSLQGVAEKSDVVLTFRFESQKDQTQREGQRDQVKNRWQPRLVRVTESQSLNGSVKDKATA